MLKLDTEYIGQLIAALPYLIVGIGLMRLALRTKQRPESLLGVYFLGTGLDYLLYTVPVVFLLDSLAPAGEALARVTYAVAVVALLMFIREVFRPRQRWALWLSWLCAATLGVGTVGGFWQGQLADPKIDDFFYWPYFVSYSVSCVWLAVEALLAHSSARKRHAIGLCEPIVVNRYLLWGAFGVFQVLASGGVLITDVQVLVNNGEVSRWADVLLSACEIGSVAMLWLAFFPPAFYRSWVGGANADTKTQEGP